MLNVDFGILNGEERLRHFAHNDDVCVSHCERRSREAIFDRVCEF